MSILDIFNFKPAAPAAPAAAAATPAPGTAPAGATPTPSAADPLAFQAGKQGGESPLANFADLWKIDDTNKPIDPTAALTPNFKIDPAAVVNAAKTVDYAKLVPPELMTKALSGDANAMGAVLNAVTQASTANAGMNTAKIVEAALAHQAKQLMSILPGQVRQQQVNMQVNQDHPIFSNPAAAPMVDMLKNQFATKFPMATPAQISEYTANYLTEFVSAVGGSMPTQQQQAATAASAAAEPDWGKFFGVAQ